MNQRPLKVAVVGGGIAGLASALNIERGAAGRGLPVAVTVFESEPEVGGNLRTIVDGGYQVEGGPNGFLDNEPATLRLMDAAGLRPELQRSEDATRHRFLLRAGNVEEMPMTPPAFLKTRMLSPLSKVRVAGELLVPARRDLGRADIDPDSDETVYDFGVRRLGREFAEAFLDPMVKGIFGGDARKLSLAAAFPRMVDLEKDHGGLFRALLKISIERKRKGDGAASPAPSGVLHSFRAGMEVLPRAVASAIGGEIRLGEGVSSIRRIDGGWEIAAGDSVHGPFAAVVEAAPAHAAAGHFDDAELSSRLAAIPYAPMAVITTAYDRAAVKHSLSGFGMLVPTRERMRLLGVLWSASIFTGRAPDGKVILRAMAGGASDTGILDLDDAELLALARRELGPLFGIDGDPERSWVIRWPRAIAQFEPGHLANLAAIERRVAASEGLFLTGSSYRGISVNHCAADAERIGVAVLDHLAAASPAAAAAAGREG